MRWLKDPRYRAGGYWRCTVRENAQRRQRYSTLDGPRYNALLLRHRRDKALVRIKARHMSTEERG